MAEGRAALERINKVRPREGRSSSVIDMVVKSPIHISSSHLGSPDPAPASLLMMIKQYFRSSEKAKAFVDTNWRPELKDALGDGPYLNHIIIPLTA